MAHEELLKDKWYHNWVKASLALKYLKEGIVSFVNKKVEHLHASFLSDIQNTIGLTEYVACDQCTTENVLQCPTRGICVFNKGNCMYHEPGKPPRKCPNKICDKLFEKIRIQHLYGTPSWKNTDATKWCSHPWELAKCFISETGYKNKTTAEETDCPGVLSVAINGLFIQNELAFPIDPPKDPFSKCRQARNAIMHSATLKVTDVELGQYIDDMIDLLSDRKVLMNHPDAVTARQKLNRLKTDVVKISIEDEIEARQEALTAVEERKHEVIEAMELKHQNSLDGMAKKHLAVMSSLDQKEANITANLVKICEEQNKALADTRDSMVAKQDERKPHAETDVDTKLDASLLAKLNTLKQAESDCVARMKQVESHCVTVVTEVFAEIQMGLQQCQIEITDLQRELHDMKDRHKGRVEQLQDYKRRKDKLQKELRGMYQRHLSSIRISPLLSELSIDINKVYTQLVICDDLINDPGQTKRKKSGARGKTQKREPVNSYKDIFYRDDKACRKIFVLGDAGMGKTTWSMKMISNWLSGLSKNENGLSTLDGDEIIMLGFEFVFFVKLRHAKSDSHILKMIEKQLCTDEPELISIINEVFEHESHKCLIVLDGLDEWTSNYQGKSLDKTGLPRRNDQSECTILITTRPWKLESLHLVQEEIDRAVEIVGLDDQGTEQVVDHIVKVLNQKTGKNKSAHDFFETEGTMKALMNVPIMLTALVALWYKNGHLDGTIANVYSTMIELWIKYAERKTHGVCKMSEISDLPKIKKEWSQHAVFLPDCMSNSKMCKIYGPLLLTLGKLAFIGLFSPGKEACLVFSQESIEEMLRSDERDIALTLGILSQSKVIGSVLDEDFNLSFFHKTIQEFLASMYMISGNDEQKTDNLRTYTTYCISSENVLEMENILLFVTGMCPSMAAEMSKHVCEHDKVIPLGDSHLWEQSVPSQRLHQLLLKCVRQEPIVSSSNNHIHIKHHYLYDPGDAENDAYNNDTIKYIQRHCECRSLALTVSFSSLSLRFKLIDVMLECLKKAHRLNNITISNIRKTSYEKGTFEKFKEALENVQQIEKLTLHHVHCDEQCLSTSADVDLSHNTALRTFEYKHSNVPVSVPTAQLEEVNIDSSYTKFNEFIQSLEQSIELTTLCLHQVSTGPINLFHNTKLKNLTLERVTTNTITLPPNGCLQEVSICEIEPHSTFSQLMSDLQHQKNLEQLKLADSDLNEYMDGFTCINLASYPQLKRLKLCSVTSTSITLPPNCSLQVLKLNSVKSNTITLPSNACLQEVKLNIVQPEATLRQFMQALQYQGKLESLCFKQVQDAETVKCMLASLAHLRQVKQLNLNSVDFGSDSLNIPVGMISLEKADIEYCKMSHSSWKTFVKSVVNLKQCVCVRVIERAGKNTAGLPENIMDIIRTFPRITKEKITNKHIVKRGGLMQTTTTLEFETT